MPLDIDYQSKGFPGVMPRLKGQHTLTTSWDDLLWAAITVGRPNPQLADRAAGAILRKAFNEHRTIGGDDVGLDDIVRTVRATTFGQPKTDPSGEMRLKAYVDGWEQGSECLEAHYIPINPAR